MGRTLFAGWRPDDAGRAHLSRLVSAMQVARPADAPRPKVRRADQWHVTLCFIGHADVLRGAGIRPIRDTAQPHLTLAYLPRHLPPQPWLAEVDCALPLLQVERFELLLNPGGRYDAVAEWPLDGTSPAPGQPGLF